MARRSTLVRAALGVAVCFVFITLVALGTWQIHRRTWKLDLIARVDARVHAAPVKPPGPGDWSAEKAKADAYSHVTLRGTFRDDRETAVQAVTIDGPGFWILAPLETGDGFTVLINRGFVPTDRREPATRAAGHKDGPVTVTGLLRASEPGGAFLRTNDPQADRWYSRDVQAIATARALGPVAPYFIDADATPNPGGYPIGGLTVVDFPNNHLVYAVTWYGLAAMLAGATAWMMRGTPHRPDDPA